MLLIAVSCRWVATPSRSVNVPPASSTIAHGGDVVGRHADGVDGDVDGSLGHEHVLPEVAEPAGRQATPARSTSAGAGRARPSPG